jgi:photosystem II stability/assembly factor-like uncharacterized protein
MLHKVFDQHNAVPDGQCCQRDPNELYHYVAGFAGLFTKIHQAVPRSPFAKHSKLEERGNQYCCYLSLTQQMKNIFTIFCFLLFILSSTAHSQQLPSPLEQSYQTYKEMKKVTRFNQEWVSLGPTVNSARADVLQVDPSHPGTMYVGYGSGGLWKTVNNGISWNCIFQDQASLGIGDMELAPSDPNIIYIGTGENLKKPRNFTLPGTGMYRSGDAGKTWQHIGLEDSWSIAEIAIHPKNPDIVMVAVLGHLWSKNKNRGLYRTTDGGKHWQQVLYKDDATGANDIVIAPSKPEIMYSSLWEVYPGISGKNSGVYRSNDGGKSWTPRTNGLPSGPLVGRIGLTVSYTDPLKAYALVDNLHNIAGQSAELYKTTDGGLSWHKTHPAPFKIFSVVGWYFTDVYVNPKDDEEVYCLGVRLAHSVDGGKTFSIIGGTVTRANPGLARTFHLDKTELWIDPNNPNHIAAGNDGGFYVSYDKGLSWFHYNNIPVGEFYDITIDQKNYMIYGGTQDDATVCGPPKEINPRIPDPWKYIWIDPWDGGDGCVTQVDPDNDNIVYYSMQNGSIVRLDRNADTSIGIRPRLPKEIKDTLLYNYIAPYFISPHQKETLYHGGNYIFKSNDRGNTWNLISPNLTVTANKEKQSFSTGALAESYLQKGLLYAGTDKGAFWVSKNDGLNWEENDSGLANNYIRSICPSRFAKERVYVAMTGINYDDLQSYCYVSEDNGKTWSSIASGLPNEPVNVILEDPADESILYAGGLRGVYVSIDRGKSWSYLGNNMPATAIADLEIHESTMDLIAATHGRGIYKINLQAVHELANKKFSTDKDHLFAMAEGQLPWFQSASRAPDYRTAEKTEISYWLNKAKRITLSLKDSANNEIWLLKTEGRQGFNEYRWDLIISRETSDLPYFTQYEKYLKEGKYKMILSDGETRSEQPFIVKRAVSPYKK